MVQASARRRRFAPPVTIFLLVFAVYLSSKGAVPLTDTRFTIPVALSLVHHGNPYLDNYPGNAGIAYGGDGGWDTVAINGHRLPVIPLGTPLLITPLVAVIDRFYQLVWSTSLYDRLLTAPGLVPLAPVHSFLASLISALTAVFVYLAGRQRLSAPRAGLLALIFAFATPAWSTASRDLWQHTCSALLLAISLYLLLLAQKQPRVAQWVSVPLALAYVVRPTNSLAVVVITLYVLLRHRKQLVTYLVLGGAIAVAFFAVSRVFYGSWLPPYYLPQRLGGNPNFWEALAANLVSPARGLFVYSPILLLSFVGVALMVRRRGLDPLGVAVICIIVVHWVSISTFAHWWGGASYGPRFFTDVMPFFMYLLIPVVEWLRLPRTALQISFVGASVVCLSVSLFMHLRGATQPRTWDWNMAHLNVVQSVDDQPGRVWDWSDPPFWRGLRPANLVVRPAEECLVIREGQKLKAPLHLSLLNPGDKPLDWEVHRAGRLFPLPAERRIPQLGYDELLVDVDTAGLKPGLQDLGGVDIVARSPDGTPVQNAVAVIPVSLRILPNSGRPGSDQRPVDQATRCEGQSTDQVAGPASAKPPQSKGVVYGAGWYDAEQYGQVSLRWAASPAVVFVYSPSRADVVLASTLSAAYGIAGIKPLGGSTEMLVTVNHEDPRRLAVRVGAPFEVGARLGVGWNVITVASAQGNFRPVDFDPKTGDTRKLSLALAPITVSSR